jgi:hypothetical protein
VVGTGPGTVGCALPGEMRWRLLLLFALDGFKGRELVKETWRFAPFLLICTDGDCGPPILEFEETDSEDEEDDDDEEEDEDKVLSLSRG